MKPKINHLVVLIGIALGISLLVSFAVQHPFSFNPPLLESISDVVKGGFLCLVGMITIPLIAISSANAMILVAAVIRCLGWWFLSSRKWKLLYLCIIEVVFSVLNAAVGYGILLAAQQ